MLKLNLTVSPEMMQLGQDMEGLLGRGTSTVQYFEADVSSPESLSHLPLRYRKQGYDMVMANWVFDHAGSPEALDGMLRSCVDNLKPGGRFIGTRIYNSLDAPAVSDGRYGVTYKNHEKIPGGVSFRYRIHVDPPVEFDAVSMEDSYNPGQWSTTHARYGLEDLQIEPFENASWVRSDPEYWKVFTDFPVFAVVKARKRT